MKKPLMKITKKWNIGHYKLSDEAASGFIQRSVSLNFFNKPEQYMTAYNQTIANFVKGYSLCPKKLFVITIANWTAPSMLTSQDLDLQANMMSHSASINP